MTRWQRRQRRKDEVKARAKAANHMYGYCRIIGCGRPARAGTSDGLDERYCRAHADHYQRHGDPLKGSYAATVLNPHRRAAFDWLTGNQGDFWIKNGVERVNGLYRRAGAHVEAFRLRGLQPEERAKAAWARLRKADVDPRLPLAAWLAVEMAIREDPQAVTKTVFKRVQAAKVVHRLASGSHKRWVQQRPNPAWPGTTRQVVEELHIYPKSRGRVLRQIGQDLEQAAELIAEHHIDDILAFKKEREAEGRLAKRPHPSRGVRVRRRRDGG